MESEIGCITHAQPDLFELDATNKIDSAIQG
jgi:hypothetical protein